MNVLKRIVFVLLIMLGYVSTVAAQDDSLNRQDPASVELPVSTDTVPVPVKKPAPVIK